MKFFKKLLILLVLISTVITSLLSCDRKYDEAEVIAAATRLIQKADVLEDILYGEGYAPDTMDASVGAYKKADIFSINQYSERLGESVNTVDELKAAVMRVYTAGYASNIISVILNGSMDSYTRYYQDREDIMVYTTFQKRKTDEIEYHYQTLKVDDVDGEKITVSIEVTVTTKDARAQRKRIQIDMLEESSGWRLDTSAFTVYNDRGQEYKDLENELNKR